MNFFIIILGYQTSFHSIGSELFSFFFSLFSNPHFFPSDLTFREQFMRLTSRLMKISTRELKQPYIIIMEGKGMFYRFILQSLILFCCKFFFYVLQHQSSHVDITILRMKHFQYYTYFQLCFNNIFQKYYFYKLVNFQVCRPNACW